MKLRLADAAEADLKSAVNWYNNEREGLGDEFLDEVAWTMKEIE